MASKKIKKALLKRRPDSNKSDFGHVFVIAGSLGMTGAAYLASEAALLSGSGLVTLGIPESLNAILARKVTEVMTRPLPQTVQQSLSLKAFDGIKRFIASRKPEVLAIGPGLSSNKQTQALVRRIVSEVELPMVIDADGLNALAGHLKILKCARRPARIITPHPGEMARLMGISVERVQKDRKGIAKKIAIDYNIIAVLKGHHTVVASPNGRLWINNTGNPGMASAGCGDVLTGMIASFLGQGIEPFEAAKLGTYLHGLAGDIAVKKIGQASLIATDLLNNIHKAIKSLAR
jgi:NAD(P)H-hydrate epimerase